MTVRKRLGHLFSTKNPIRRVAHNLGIGEATVKRIIARYNQDGEKIVIPETKPRGKPVHQVSRNLQPIVGDYIRFHNLRGQYISIEKVRNFLIEKHHTEILATTLWQTLKYWGFYTRCWHSVFGLERERLCYSSATSIFTFKANQQKQRMEH